MPHFFNKTVQRQSAAERVRSQQQDALSEALSSKVTAGDDDISRIAISMEGYNQDSLRDVQTMYSSVRDHLSAVAKSIGLESMLDDEGKETGRNNARLDAGASAAVSISSSNLRAFTSRTFEAPVALAGARNGEITSVVGLEGMNDAYTRRVALENFDDRDNRNAKVTSVSYNLNAAQQNEFGETFFPTVTISNDMVGVAVSIRLISVIKDFTRNADASLADFRRRNVVRALLDHTILRNDSNKLVPQWKPQTQANFSTRIGSFTKVIEGVTHTTGALKINTRIGDLISLGYPEATSHALNQGDTLDPSISVAAVYVVLGSNKIRLNLSGFRRAGFLAAPEDDTRLQNLNLDLRTLSIRPNTLQHNAAALVDELLPVVTNKWTVQLRLNMTGNVSVSSGEIVVHGNALEVVNIIDEDGNPVDMTVGAAKAIVDLVNKDAIDSYDIDARLSNLNRRQRGQIMDTTVYNQVWTVPLRSPITYPRPINATNETDAADLAVLVSTTHARTSNEAVTTLFEAADAFSEYQNLGKTDLDTIPPERFGISRLVLNPTYKYKEVNLVNIIQNAKSHEKEKDISAEIVLNLKNLAYEMYRDSGFQAFVESGAAGVTGNPTVLVGTDPYTSRWIQVVGDNRTMGPDFNFKIVTTPDERFQGNIAIAFGYPDMFSGEINPAHFGNMLWASETVLVLQMNRNGDAQKETTVQPRFRHIINTPVLGWMVLTGIPEVIATRVPRSFQQLAGNGVVTPPTP